MTPGSARNKAAFVYAAVEPASASGSPEATHRGRHRRPVQRLWWDTMVGQVNSLLEGLRFIEEPTRYFLGMGGGADRDRETG